MSDLYPGMAIEISTTLISAPSPTDRPSWLHSSAMWPPQPGKVMYMIRESSTGICDECILTCGDEIRKLTRGSRMVEERGSDTWYCSCHPDERHCERWWNGSGYPRD